MCAWSGVEGKAGRRGGEKNECKERQRLSRVVEIATGRPPKGLQKHHENDCAGSTFVYAYRMTSFLPTRHLRGILASPLACQHCICAYALLLLVSLYHPNQVNADE
mgnify:CR=1 FL=1